MWSVWIQMDDLAGRVVAEWCQSRATTSPTWWSGRGQGTQDNQWKITRMCNTFHCSRSLLCNMTVEDTECCRTHRHGTKKKYTVECQNCLRNTVQIMSCGFVGVVSDAQRLNIIYSHMTPLQGPRVISSQWTPQRSHSGDLTAHIPPPDCEEEERGEYDPSGTLWCL